MRKLYLLISGLCLGWMVGMSSSPVVSAIISSLLVVIITGISIVGKSNISGEKFKDISIVPITILIVALTFGSASGIITRTRGLLNFSMSNDSEYELLTQLGLYTKYGLDSTEIVRRIFNSKYPLEGVAEKDNQSKNDGSLHVSITKNECVELCMKDTSNIIRAIERSANSEIKGLKLLRDKSVILENIQRICDCD